MLATVEPSPSKPESKGSLVAAAAALADIRSPQRSLERGEHLLKGDT